MSIKKYLLSYLAVDSLVAVYGAYKGSAFFISSQLGFVSTLLITLSSYQSYKKMVANKLANGDIPQEERELLDKIDDRFELYDEADEEEKDFKEVIKEERKKLKGFKSSVKSVKKTFFAFISPLRIFSYLFLILGFLYLNTHHLLNIYAFVLGISVVSIVTLVAGFIKPAT